MDLMKKAETEPKKTRDYKGNFVCPHGGPCPIYESLPENMKKALEKQTCGAPGVDCAVKYFKVGSDFDRRLRKSL